MLFRALLHGVDYFHGVLWIISTNGSPLELETRVPTNKYAIARTVRRGNVLPELNLG